MAFIIGIGIFIFGLVIGSFLNCVIFRLEKGESLMGRSYCIHCKHHLVWLDLVPVFSFLFLQGKCRYCGKRISWQYPAVEISTALVFLLISNIQFPIPNQFGISQFLNILFLFYIASSLIIIFVYDLRHYLIPDKVLFPAVAIALIFRIWNFGHFIGNRELGIGNYLLAAAIAFVFFLSIFLISKGRWMGFGDVKLAILLGLLLGVPDIFLGLFLAFFFGAIIGISGMLLGKKRLKSEMPFAPFLILGTGVAMFWAPEIINWYVSLFLF